MDKENIIEIINVPILFMWQSNAFYAEYTKVKRKDSKPLTRKVLQPRLNHYHGDHYIHNGGGGKSTGIRRQIPCLSIPMILYILLQFPIGYVRYLIYGVT